MTKGDLKKLKKPQAKKLLQIALDGRRRLSDRRWACEQLALSGYTTPATSDVRNSTVFARLREMRHRLALGKGVAAKDLINHCRRI